MYKKKTFKKNHMAMIDWEPREEEEGFIYEAYSSSRLLFSIASCCFCLIYAIRSCMSLIIFYFSASFLSDIS